MTDLKMERDSELWSQVLERVQEKYHLTDAGIELLSKSGDWFLRPIDHAENLRELDEPTIPLPSRQIEPLLSQAIELLNRLLRDQQEFDELREKCFSTWIELYEFLGIDRILQDEIEAGLFEMPYERARANQEAETGTLEALRSVSALLAERLGTYSSAEAQEKYVEKRQMAASVNAAPARIATKGSQWYEGPWPVSSGNKMNVAGHLERSEATIAAAKEALAVETSLLQNQADELAVDSRLGATRKETEWQAKNRGFQLSRTQLHRNVLDRRVREAVESGGALNYVDRMESILSRALVDLAEVRARLEPIARGMASIYGYSDPLPSPDIDGYVLWARKVANFLAALARYEQSAVVPISIRAQLGEEQWRAGLSAGQWSLTLSEDHFPDLVSLRLRGLIGWVESSSETAVWSLRVTAPPTSIQLRLKWDGSGEVEREEVGQKDALPVFLGRCFSRQQGRRADVSGVSSLHNVSPFGTWTVRVPTRASGEAGELEIADVVLDFQVAYFHRPVEA